MAQLASTATITAIGLTCKAFLNSGLCSITIKNMSTLLNALNCKMRCRGQGVVTVSNHLSTLDDPVIWGALPVHCYLNTRTTRWALGASDILFTNPVFSAFFRKGQVIETFRGKGVSQPALDEAIDKLNQGHWVHLFGEGGVRQPANYPQVDGLAYLSQFKWGVGRVIMEADVLPLVIPMWLTGFDKLMPENRPWPYKYFPKLGVNLGVAFGDPIPPHKVPVLLDSVHQNRGATTGHAGHSFDPSSEAYGSLHVPGLGQGPGDGVGGTTHTHSTRCVASEITAQKRQMDHVRSEVTAVIQRAVEDLGRAVSGNKLDRPLVLSQPNQ